MSAGPKIFLSYRRDDAAFQTTAIHEKLVEAFGAESVFMDVDNIPAGRDFRAHLQEAIAQCDVCLAVIGDKWLHICDDDGNRRLEDPRDFVRIELEAALARGIPVIPLLVSNKGVPPAASLPKSLEELSYRHAVSIRPGRDFRNDVKLLIEQIAASPVGERSKPQLPVDVPAAVAAEPDSRKNQLGTKGPVSRPAARTKKPPSRTASPSDRESRKAAKPLREHSGVTVHAAHAETSAIPRIVVPAKVTAVVMAAMFAVLLLIVLAICLSAPTAERLLLSVVAAILSSVQAAFIFTVGTSDPLAPFPPRRRWIPILMAAFMIAPAFVSIAALFHDFVLMPLSSGLSDLLAFGLKGVLGISWTAVVWNASRKWTRFMFFQRMCQNFIGGSLLELLVCILLWFGRGRDWAESGIFLGFAVATFPFGPAAIWLMMRRVNEKHKVPGDGSL